MNNGGRVCDPLCPWPILSILPPGQARLFIALMDVATNVVHDLGDRQHDDNDFVCSHFVAFLLTAVGYYSIDIQKIKEKRNRKLQ